MCPNLLSKIHNPFETPETLKSAVRTPAVIVLDKMLHGYIEKGKPRIVILCGKNGCGKSHALEILKTECRGLGIVFSSVDWSAMIKAKEMGIEGNPYISKVCRGIKKSKIVVSDEFGRYKEENRHEQEMAEELVRLCYRQRTLVLATNMEPRGMISIFGEGYCLSRIRDVGETYNLGFGKEHDYRQAENMLNMESHGIAFEKSIGGNQNE